MAGFEVVVRPVVFPDIRPRARQSLPPQDDPEKGIAVIKGNPAQSVGLSDSWSVSTTRSRPQETERRVDEVRVYQKEEDGTVNKDNYVDVDVANRITLRKPGTAAGKTTPEKYTKETYSYTKMDDDIENGIEVRRRNIIKKNPDLKG